MVRVGSHIDLVNGANVSKSCFPTREELLDVKADRAKDITKVISIYINFKSAIYKNMTYVRVYVYRLLINTLTSRSEAAFSFSALLLWNKLPEYLRSANTVSSLTLKTSQFTVALH